MKTGQQQIPIKKGKHLTNQQPIEVKHISNEARIINKYGRIDHKYDNCFGFLCGFFLSFLGLLVLLCYRTRQFVKWVIIGFIVSLFLVVILIVTYPVYAAIVISSSDWS